MFMCLNSLDVFTVFFPNYTANLRLTFCSFSCKLSYKSLFGRDYHIFFGSLYFLIISGLSLLKVGGRMVYSTCSMNPVENEAVVAEVRCQLLVGILEATIMTMRS